MKKRTVREVGPYKIFVFPCRTGVPDGPRIKKL